MEPLEMQSKYQAPEQLLVGQELNEELLTKQQPQLLAAQPPGPRDFHKHCYDCCGDCDSAGWGACCLSFWLPWFATGWNLQRATGNWVLSWGVGLLLLASMVASTFVVHKKLINKTIEIYFCEEQFVCERVHRSLNWDRLVMLIVLQLVAMLIGLASRRYIRKVLNLDSLNHNHVEVFCTDFWSHFFVRCGLCQETRTMIINNVENGVWKGPSTMVAPAIAFSPQIPPTTQHML